MVMDMVVDTDMDMATEDMECTPTSTTPNVRLT